jgi:hypothetical protein
MVGSTSRQVKNDPSLGNLTKCLQVSQGGIGTKKLLLIRSKGNEKGIFTIRISQPWQPGQLWDKNALYFYFPLAIINLDRRCE